LKVTGLSNVDNREGCMKLCDIERGFDA